MRGAFLLFAPFVFSPLEGATDRIEIHVAPQAGATTDGSADHPYAMLPDAVNALRDLRDAGNAKPAVIYLRQGRHQLLETLVLGVNDGSPAAVGGDFPEAYGAGETMEPPHLTIASFPGEQAVVSAGVPVDGWTLLEEAPPGLPSNAAGKVWVAEMPEGMQRFYTLYDSKGRLNRARDKGFAPTASGTKRQIHFPKGALKNWDNVEDVEIQVRPSRAWVINMLPLASVDEETGIAETGVSATYEMSPLAGYLTKHFENAVSVWVENTLEGLDEPGEWVVNTKTRKIYLWPSDPAADGSPRDILAPATSELIRVEGEIDYDGAKDNPVRGVAFSGLTFTHADRWAWKNDESRLGYGMQHDWDMFDKPTAMLRFRGSENCEVSGCRFIDSGGSGLRMDLHAQRNRLEGCEFAHLGEAGILLAGYGPGTKDVNHHNEIISNHIHHFSEITWHSPGIWAWQSGHNRIAHNELHHAGYAAILVTNRIGLNNGANSEGGRTLRHAEISEEAKQHPLEDLADWKIREKYHHSRHNLVEHNDISHCVQLLSDGNAIYISGAGTGNVIRYNFFHDNNSPSLPSLIRCDDDQHETLIHGNILSGNIGYQAGIVSKGINDITNNFIVSPAAVPKLGYISFEWVSVEGSKVERNIIVSHPDGGKIYAEREKGRSPGPENVKPDIEGTEMDGNLYFHPADPDWAQSHLERMRAVGKERASRSGHPLFNDPVAGDFGFLPDSPALNLGIEPLNISKAGLLD